MAGDGLVRPLNAPPAVTAPPGVQPGVNNQIVLARYVIVFGDNGGVFLYVGTPALGNGPVAWLTLATTDPYGNAVTPELGVGVANITTIEFGGGADMFADGNGDIGATNASGQAGRLVLSQTSTLSVNTGNVTVKTDITTGYTLNSAVVGTVAEVATDFNGVWGGQLLTFYADINGTFTQVGLPVGAVFGSGVASGDAVAGWGRMVFRVVSATTVRVHLEGAIFDSTQNSGHISTSTQVNLGGTDVTGVTFAAGDTLAIAIAFGGSTAGQTIITEGSDFTVKLP
jgi:hypothetical protein